MSFVKKIFGDPALSPNNFIQDFHRLFPGVACGLLFLVTSLLPKLRAGRDEDYN